MQWQDKDEDGTAIQPATQQQDALVGKKAVVILREIGQKPVAPAVIVAVILLAIVKKLSQPDALAVNAQHA